jgi:hypothetical protein
MERQEPYIGDGTPPPPIRERPPSGNRTGVWVIVAALVLCAAVAVWSFVQRVAMQPARSVETAAPASPPPSGAQGPRHPVDGEPVEQPLPALRESDGAVSAALAALVGSDAFGRIFLTENLVRNIVATVDNLPREEVVRRVNPLQPVPGIPATTGKGERLTLAPANGARYAEPMRVVETVETAKLVAFYRRHYPLFQQAYVELGYPNGYFNDRLVEVIDHLLAAPEPAGPIRLTQPKVLYEFADPALEGLSAGQKMMLRLGKDNRGKVKAKLVEIRAGITSR